MTAQHQHAMHHEGPRVPARYGSYATQVCECGAWRAVVHGGPEHTWHPADELHESTSCTCGEEYELDDGCRVHGNRRSLRRQVSP